MPFFSIIIPVYNTEKYLKRCLDSVVNQTFRNIEIIVVNDCSPNTIECDSIIDSYNDNRIIYIKHNENKGLLAARKTGYLKALGEYIITVDSDDYVDFNMCDTIYKVVCDKKVDIVHFSVQAFVDTSLFNDKKEYIREIKKVERYASSTRSLINRDYLFLEFLEEKIGHNMWGKAYKKCIIDKIIPFIPDIRLVNAEDMLQSFIIFYFAKNYISISDSLYYYFISSGDSNKNTDRLSLEEFEYMCESNSKACSYIDDFLKIQNVYNIYSNYYNKIYFRQFNLLKSKIRDERYTTILNKYFSNNNYDRYIDIINYEKDNIKKYTYLIDKLTPYFFSIILYEYYINIKILGIRINLTTKNCFSKPYIVSFNSLLKNIFSINAIDKYMTILFIKIPIK